MSCATRSKDDRGTPDFSNDPEVKKWLSELQSDFVTDRIKSEDDLHETHECKEEKSWDGVVGEVKTANLKDTRDCPTSDEADGVAESKPLENSKLEL